MASLLVVEPPPLQNDLIIGKTPSGQPDLRIAAPWARWFELALVARLQATSPQVTSVAYASQSASLGSTSMVALASGIYRASWYARVVQAATTSSSLIVTWTTTDLVQSIPQAGAAMTGNLITTAQSGVFLVRCDASTPLTVSTAYASVGATPMLYDLALIVEAVTTS